VGARRTPRNFLPSVGIAGGVSSEQPGAGQSPHRRVPRAKSQEEAPSKDVTQDICGVATSPGTADHPPWLLLGRRGREAQVGAEVEGPGLPGPA
jgi:hypothetical protein